MSENEEIDVSISKLWFLGGGIEEQRTLDYLIKMFEPPAIPTN